MLRQVRAEAWQGGGEYDRTLGGGGSRRGRATRVRRESKKTNKGRRPLLAMTLTNDAWGGAARQGELK